MRFLPRRTLWRALLTVAVVLIGLGVAAIVVVLSKPGDVSHPNVEFTSPTGQAAATTTPTKPSHKRAAPFSWPIYGYSPTRTRDFVAPADLRPPLHVGWRYHTGALLEFPPSIEGDSLYLLDDSGAAHRIDTQTGKVDWSRKVGTLAAATPALDPTAGLALMPVLSDHSHSPGNGRFVALSMKTGKVRWSRPLPAGSESSPVISGDTVYFGDGGGTLYALDVRTGKERWTYKASGAIKGGPALWHGVLYFGDYGGRAYAIRASDGKQVWARATNGAHYGLGSGNFYATPSVAYGRVYMGNTDGRMYAFAARTGTLAWATATGSYIYSSAAIADPKGLGPTVYAGSYDGYFYAFDARTGSVRWRNPAGGRISGSAIVIGDVVYYSDLATHTTTGLDLRTGDVVLHFHDGAFTPAVADEHAIYLIGGYTMYQMLPGAKPAHRRHPAPKAHRKTIRPAAHAGRATHRRRHTRS